MKKLVEHYCELPLPIRPILWRLWHHILNRLDADYSNIFLNYGYASPNGEFKDLVLAPHDEPNRYGIQLYHHATRGASLQNKSVLEVGCGRGGGASFLARYHQPKEYIAMDISERLMAYCTQFHQAPGLSFICGSAMHLPFDADRFDAIVNIESARCYPDTGAFFQEVYRVLKPGGHFFFTDMIQNKDVDSVHAMLQKPGFSILQQKDIRENVVRALQLDTEARRRVIKERAPTWLQQSLYEFAGVEGSNRFNVFSSNEMQYRSYILQKPNKLP